MYCKLRTELFRPVLWPERKACKTVLIVFLQQYLLVEFLWKLLLRKMKIISANADQNFDNFSQTLGPFNIHFWANRP